MNPGECMMMAQQDWKLHTGFQRRGCVGYEHVVPLRPEETRGQGEQSVLVGGIGSKHLLRHTDRFGVIASLIRRSGSGRGHDGCRRRHGLSLTLQTRKRIFWRRPRNWRRCELRALIEAKGSDQAQY